MVNNLPCLPEDIIMCILSELEIASVFSLRLACRSLNVKSLFHFGRHHFGTIRTDLSSTSLDSLLLLSENVNLVIHVKCLRIKISPNELRLGQGFHWSRHSEGHLLHPTKNVKSLRHLLFTRLINCRMFHVYSDVDDGGIWRKSSSYGDHIMPSDAVGIMLAMIADSGMAVESFCINFTTVGIGRIDARCLEMSRYMTPQFTDAWSRLQDLSIEQTLTPESFDKTLPLVLAATNLRKLSLRFEHTDSGRFINRLISANVLHGLEELALSSSHLSKEAFSRLLRCSYHTLRSISLSSIYLRSGDEWVSIFDDIIRRCPNLARFSFCRLRQEAQMYDVRRNERTVAFSLLNVKLSELSRSDGFSRPDYGRCKEENRLIGVQYEGRVAPKALEDLSESVVYV